MCTRRLLSILALLLFACAAPTDGGLATTNGALSVGGLTPWPCDVNTGASKWEGDTVQLLVADAWAGCSKLENGDFDQTYFGNDPYLQEVMQHMLVALGPFQGGVFDAWVSFRAEPNNNCDPITKKQATSPVVIVGTPVKESIAFQPSNTDGSKRANSQLRQAGVNFCIAQRLRNRSPGASAGDALLLSEAEQRLLLETIRERAQTAMLQYALLGVAFSTSPQTLTNPHGSQTIPLLQDWAANHVSDMMVMGRDFAAAVQLHSMVSEELFQLFARSRSARSPRGGVSPTRADETWGEGSWHQRLLVAAYGGDPLALVDDATPWTHWNPDADVSGWAGVELPAYSWPDSLKRPYATVRVDEPQVQELLSLARSYEQIALLPDTSTGCEPYDVEASGTDLYKNVEAHVRLADCYRTNPTDPCPTTAVSPTKEYGKEPYLLYEKYRITPEHAQTLARLLAQSLGGRKSSGACGTSYNDAQFGARNLRVTVTESAGGTVQFSKDLAFSDVTPWEVAPTYTRNAALRFPTPWDIDPAIGKLWDVASYDLGFDDYCISSGCPAYRNADAKRLMGAMAAQTAVRDMVFESVVYLESGQGQGWSVFGSYFAMAGDILKLVEASNGAATVSIRPQVKRLAASPPRAEVVSDAVGYQTQVKLLVSPEDTWWDWSWSDAEPLPSKYTGVFALQGPWTRMLAAQPESSIFGKTLADLIQTEWANPNGRWALAIPSQSSSSFIVGLPKLWLSFPLRLPSATDTYTLVAVRYDSKAPEGEQLSYRLLGANVRLLPSRAAHGQYWAGGGALGGLVARQSAVKGSSPSEPALDAFDLPTDWVPPFSAELIGGSAGETSAAVYLKLAKESANTARGAVESALQDLLQQQQDDATLKTAASKASAGLKEERDRLCGNDNADCVTSFSSASIPNTLPDCNPAGLAESALVKCELERFAYTIGKDVAAQSIPLATPVFETLDHPTVPAFSSYMGGSLQTSFVEQWTTMKAVPAKLDLLGKTVQAAKSTIDAADAALVAAGLEKEAKCSANAMENALLAGYQVKDLTLISTGPDGFAEVHFSYDMWAEDTPMSLAPLHAQQQACDTAKIAIEPMHASVIQARDAAILEIGTAAVGLLDAVGAVRIAAAKGAMLVNEAELAERRNELEVKLTGEGLVTSFSVYRISRGYDLWRARALVENTRRYAVAARRAIEARHVVDLSSLDKDEAFVASPKVWADEIYGYDLTLPAAVGLTVSGSSKGDAIYANKLTDYVANLEAFVAGYAVTRPIAVAGNEIDVVTLPGLKPGDPVTIPLDPTDPESPTITAYPSQGTWLVRCPVSGSSPQWVPLSSSCAKPDRAKLQFTLDPWGRVNDAIANEPFEKRFNARWGLLAVNFVGTGIRDCQNAIDPKGCYAEPFIKYNLTHVGPSWVTDFDERWQLLGAPTGRIEAGKGLAAELWLDPLKDGWSTSYISAVARTEWQHRPLGGAYELEFEVTPDVKLDRIERLQLLVGSTSWVKQQ